MRTTQIRLPEDIGDYIEQKAEKLGISKNALMIILLDLGKKMYESDITFLSTAPPN